ncbi:MAG: hypothetical protein CVU29_09435 [Betaproteobacteria bacterium HGW-Betaproteobacteria-22]|nr:MAG: hypothetical protein CVU29_09435 [Betaproteobacteria bacterium HGW-Betaproteobacteria-22]
MSLLIKALETAEKEKRAEQEKKQLAGEDAPVLEMAPLDEIVPADPAHEVAGEERVLLATNAVTPETPLADDTDSGLSLTDEAGLSEEIITKRPLHKTKTVKASPKATPDRTINKADAFNAAALASVAKLKLEADAAKANHQKAAAGVFVANHSNAKPSSALALLLLGVAGVLAVWLGLKGYQYIKDANTPSPVVIQPAPAVVSVETALIENGEAIEVTHNQPEVTENADSELDVNRMESVPVALDEVAAVTQKPKTKVLANEGALAKPLTLPEQQVEVSEKQTQMTQAAAHVGIGGVAARAPLRLVSKVQPVGVDPLLSAAYEAYKRGEDTAAQQQYRQVLQRDVRNVDALLGMAAIAQRQDRQADAVGWYQKVLETEPRNTIARAAINQIEADTDPVGAESKIKNMLALQPESANLHAALGHLYAAQQQWPAAQDAYFNASRFAPASADYAFNLAVSLDHLGKRELALAQYQRALSLLNDAGTASLDRSQLEERISALK